MTNFHTHSIYCDGKATLREMAEFAVAHGFKALGFSGHCPLPFENTFSITDYEGYCGEVRRLKEEYAGRMEIYLGLEMDYVPGMLEDFTPLIEQGGLEYTIGSVHLIPAEQSSPASPPIPPQGGTIGGCFPQGGTIGGCFPQGGTIGGCFPQGGTKGGVPLRAERGVVTTEADILLPSPLLRERGRG